MELVGQLLLSLQDFLSITNLSTTTRTRIRSLCNGTANFVVLRRTGDYSNQEQLKQIYENVARNLQLYFLFKFCILITLELSVKMANLIKRFNNSWKIISQNYLENLTKILSPPQYKEECCWRCHSKEDTLGRTQHL